MRSWRSWALALAGALLIAACADGSAPTPAPAQSIETAGPGVHRLPADRSSFCDTVDNTALKALLGSPIARPETTTTGSDPATVSGVRCVQQFETGLISSHLSVWTKVETARAQHDHHRDKVDAEEGKIADQPGVGAQAYRLTHRLGGPTSPILEMQVQDSNAALRLRLITDKPTEYTEAELDALFDAMGEFAVDLLAGVPKA